MLFTLCINHSLILYLLLSLSLRFSLPRMIIHTITRSTAELSQSASASLLAKLTIIALSCPSLPLCRTLSLSLFFSACLAYALPVQHESLQFPLDTVLTSHCLINSQRATCAKKKEKLS